MKEQLSLKWNIQLDCSGVGNGVGVIVGGTTVASKIGMVLVNIEYCIAVYVCIDT